MNNSAAATSNGAAATSNGRTPDEPRSRLKRLARWCFTHRRKVVLSWVAGLIVITAASVAFHGVFENKFNGGNSESAHAQSLLNQRFPSRAGDDAQVVFHTADPVTSPAVEEHISATLSHLRGLPDVAGVVSPFDPGGSSQISRDGHIAYGTVQFDKTTQDLPKASIQAVIDKASGSASPGFDIQFGGSPISKVQKFAFGAAEGVGILAAIIILLLAFGSVIAMGLPILTALFGVAIAFGVIDFMSHGINVPTFGQELAAMIGIGVGIDYALFVVTRYRQGLQDGLEPETAIVASLQTSGRAVLFAGCTVVISLLGMFLLGLPWVYGLALGSIAAVILVMAAALTLLPALIGFSGAAIDKFHVPHLRRAKDVKTHHTVAWRWSRVVQHHPIALGGAALAVLVVLAVPLFSLHMAFTDSGNDPSNLTTRKAYDLLAQGFGPGSNGPLVVAVDVPSGADRTVVTALQQKLQQTPGIAFAAAPQFNAAGDAAVLIAVPTTSPQDIKTQSLVHHLRDDVVPSVVRGTPVRALVGGETAGAVDASSQLSGRLPLVIVAVVIMSFLLLMAVFRSIAVPLKAAIMNLLSVGAAYGVIVAVFQWGWLGSFFNIGKTGPIDPWIPLMMFTILFGLSMDYEVFLLSRVREEFLRTGDNATAVADGLAMTARVITAAAAIMVCVFGSFVLGDQRALKLFGMGLATAVLVDATLVRMVLVPSTMELLGRANWWLPRWLDRVVPTISVEVEPPEHSPLVGSGVEAR
jgi:RND superfamily putative drug exporter